MKGTYFDFDSRLLDVPICNKCVV